MNKTILALAVAAIGFPASAWSHGPGGGGGHVDRVQTSPDERRRDEQRARQARLESLQLKIDKIEARLEDTALSPKKRVKLEKKLKKLYQKKDELLDE